MDKWLMEESLDLTYQPKEIEVQVDSVVEEEVDSVEEEVEDLVVEEAVDLVEEEAVDLVTEAEEEGSEVEEVVDVEVVAVVLAM